MRELVKQAYEAQKMSYSPYSNFQVGSALKTKDGNIFMGCNIENASYSPCNCAERTAIFKAVSEGFREFEAIAVVGNLKNTPVEDIDYCSPCGVCLQVMTEFCDLDEFKIVIARSEEDYKVHTLREMLPFAFTNKNL